jgi:protein-tyrosine phosphatase
MAYQVLFVCTGNVCRSPAAERLLRHHLERTGITTSSAGTGALVGEPMSPPMAALVAADGADPEGFTARQLSADMVRQADLVIAMTSAHRGDTVALLPAAVQRTFVLGELAHMLGHVRPEEVSEVAGGPASTAERLRAMVTIAKRNRTLGVDPDEDVVDPYGRSATVYAKTFRQIREGLEPLVRLALSSA